MKFVNTIAFLLLTVFAVLAVTSMWNDSANYDERIHLPAGYSYLTQQDMRLNPEHPPLIKDLSALPLLFFFAIIYSPMQILQFFRRCLSRFLWSSHRLFVPLNFFDNFFIQIFLA